MPVARALLPLQLDGRWLAVEASFAREVLGRRPWVPVPGAGAYLPGVASWRGRAVAVVDLGALTGAAASLAPGDARARTVVMQIGSCTLVLPADAVREVIAVRADEVRPPHATRQSYATGEVDFEGWPMAVLDLTAVVKAVLPSAPEAL